MDLVGGGSGGVQQQNLYFLKLHYKITKKKDSDSPVHTQITVDPPPPPPFFLDLCNLFYIPWLMLVHEIRECTLISMFLINIMCLKWLSIWFSSSVIALSYCFIISRRFEISKIIFQRVWLSWRFGLKGIAKYLSNN